MAHPNEDLLRRGYEAFGTGDMDTLRELMSPDVVWHVGGRNQLSGDYKGMDEVLGLFGRFFELTGGNMSQEIHALFADDEHGVVLVKGRAQREGKTYEGNEVHVFHLSGGKAVEFWDHPQDQYASDEFWS
jgi:uncharacterized protein